MNLPLIARTLVHVKPIQILNRLWRKRLSLRHPSRPDSENVSLPEFTFLNTTATPSGWNDSRLEKLWLYNLHYFDYLQTNTHANLIGRWMRENPVGWGNGWEPYPLSLRIVNWVKYLMASRDVVPDVAEIESSLRQQVAFLVPRLEYHLLANHLLANAKALVFAGKYFGVDKWYAKGLGIYRKELPQQTCADGVNFERSPMYHSIILEDMLDCSQLTGDELFKTYSELMLSGLALLLGADGKIAKFNDAADGIAKSPDEIVAYARELGLKGLKGLGESGFVRMEAGAYTLLAKCGEIGPSYQPGHAHADTFSFELWSGATKVVGDTGCSTYVPGSVRSYERSTAAHNTVVIDGRDSSEVWASHRVGRRFDFKRHRRTFELTDAGLKGVDELNGRGEHEVEVRFHLPPGVPADAVTIDCPGDRIVESCEFADGWNRRATGICIIFRQTLSFPARFSWTVKV